MTPRYNENEPLHLAVELGQVERVRELLRSGTKADTRSENNVTPLMVAARKGFDELVDVLIEAGANVNAKDKASRNWVGRCTPLHYACQVGIARTTRLLVDKGADPDCIDQSGRTPLTYALIQRNHPFAKFLLEHGANPNGPAKCRYVPIVVAAGKDDLTMVKELLGRGADPNRMAGEVALAETTSVEVAQELLRHGADINLKNGEGKTPLLARLMIGSFELLKCFVEAGADVNAKTKDGSTVLMCLVGNPQIIAVAEMLIAAGADINAIPWPNRSVLDWMCSLKPDNYDEDRTELIAFLESKGAKRAKELKPEKTRRSKLK